MPNSKALIGLIGDTLRGRRGQTGFPLNGSQLSSVRCPLGSLTHCRVPDFTRRLGRSFSFCNTYSSCTLVHSASNCCNDQPIDDSCCSTIWENSSSVPGQCASLLKPRAPVIDFIRPARSSIHPKPSRGRTENEFKNRIAKAYEIS